MSASGAADRAAGAGAPVPVLLGPTASGKTAVATALASLADIEIISADSRQIYRRLDVGTAKPTPAERRAAPYHGLDLIEVGERYSAGRFARAATDWIAGIRGRGRLPLVVGGTGFYVRALFEGLFAEPPLDPARRAALQRALGALDRAEVARWAGRLDPSFAGGGGRQRAARAAEVALLTGRPLSAWHRAAAPAPGPAPWYAVLTLPREVLAARIEARVNAMLTDGLVDEVRGLLAGGAPADAPGLRSVGYREVIEALAGRLEAAALPGAIARATRRYAKRQATWFRHQLTGPVLALDATRPAGEVARALLSGYRARMTSDSARDTAAG